MLRQKLVADQIAALKSHNRVRLETIRFVMSQIKNKEVDLHRELNDDETIEALRKFSKELEEAAIAFERGGRSELAVANQLQKEIVVGYLPSEIPDDELRIKIQEVMDKNPQLAGQKALIGLSVRELKNIADASRISKIAGEMI